MPLAHGWHKSVLSELGSTSNRSRMVVMEEKQNFLDLLYTMCIFNYI